VEERSLPGAAPTTPGTKDPRSLPFVDVASLADTAPLELQWLARNRIPAGNVTLLSGDGAAGKTTIALQLCVSVIAVGSWLNTTIERQGEVLFFSAEEDRNELHRRLLRISCPSCSIIA